MISATRTEAALLVVADLLLLSCVFALAYWLRFHLGILAVVEVPPPSVPEYARALGIIGIVFLVVFHTRGLYGDFPARGIDVLERTVWAVNIASAVVLAASFFQRDFSYSRAVVAMTWMGALVALPFPRVLMLKLRRRRYSRGVGLVPALVVGSWERAVELCQRLKDHRRYGLDVQGVVTVGDPPTASDGPAHLGELPDLAGVVERSGVREVLISETLERVQLMEVLEVCERIRVESRIVPHIYDLFITPRDLSELFGVPFVSAREQRFERLSLVVKRCFDLVVGGVALLVALPLVAVLVVLVRREGGGAALFRQRRVGQGGATFQMWKLRTMVPDAEARLRDLVDLDTLEQPVFKLEQDPRVTPLGRTLRRWSLDELPQLWNVVRGDMSLVGPRPEVEEVVARYDAHHRRRLKAKPGLTGLQQVEARAATDLDERIRLDVYYTRRRSFLFDLYILARTPWAVLRGRGAM